MNINGLKISFLAAIISMACTTKVSEWVLLNAVSDKYLLVYYHNGNLSEKITQQHNELMNEAEKANILFRTVQKEDVKEPSYSLYYNNRMLAEYGSYDSLRTVISSPLRENIAEELIEGQLCVML